MPVVTAPPQPTIVHTISVVVVAGTLGAGTFKDSWARELDTRTESICVKRRTEVRTILQQPQNLLWAVCVCVCVYRTFCRLQSFANRALVDGGWWALPNVICPTPDDLKQLLCHRLQAICKGNKASLLTGRYYERCFQELPSAHNNSIERTA